MSDGWTAAGPLSTRKNDATVAPAAEAFRRRRAEFDGPAAQTGREPCSNTILSLWQPQAERTDVPDIDKNKYLVPADLSVSQFMHVIRKRIKLPSEKAIFIFVNNTIPPTAALMSVLYQEQKDEDGFMYVTYSGENTFG